MLTRIGSNIFPSEDLEPPFKRVAQKDGDLGLPAGTEVFSADNHLSVSTDIFYQALPQNLKNRAPRLWRDSDGVAHIGAELGQSFLPSEYAKVFSYFEKVPGCHAEQMDARMADLAAEGITRELAFPNAILALLAWPDYEIRDLCFRIYNQYIADLQSHVPNSFYGVGLINWWDPAGTRTSLDEIKSLGVKTFLMPLSPGKFPDGTEIDYASTAMTRVWDEIAAAGIPVSHHIGEIISKGSEFNILPINFLHSVASFRETFGKYIFGGILDRHPSLQVGWFEGGIHWVVSALQDAEHAYASFKHTHNWQLKHEPEFYWQNHMCSSFVIDPLGLELIDRIGVDKAMWSSDYPHNESSFGYSRSSVKQVVNAVGPESASRMVSDNIARFLRL